MKLGHFEEATFSLGVLRSFRFVNDTQITYYFMTYRMNEILSPLKILFVFNDRYIPFFFNSCDCFVRDELFFSRTFKKSNL